MELINLLMQLDIIFISKLKQKENDIMDYSTIIELSYLTLEDCINLYEKRKLVTNINDGIVTSLELEVEVA